MGKIICNTQINKPIIGYDNYECQKLKYVPDGGKAGQVLTKLKRSYDWVDVQKVILWDSIGDKPFQNIDKNYLDVNENNELTLKDDLIKNLQKTESTLIKLQEKSTNLGIRVKKIENNLEFKNF